MLVFVHYSSNGGGDILICFLFFWAGMSRGL